MSKFKVGQKVRFKSHEELKQIGIRAGIKVDRDFIYTPKVLTITAVFKTLKGRMLFKLNESLSKKYNDGWYHKDFLVTIYELDDRFKEV